MAHLVFALVRIKTNIGLKMNTQRVILKIIALLGLTLLIVSIQDAEAGQHYHKKKKVVIHVPVHKKIEKHIHTIIKHHHHHHKPIVIKEEKVIHEEHHPIIKKEEVSHEHLHHHIHDEHEEHIPQHHHIEERQHKVEEEEEHIHHHHNYEHKHQVEVGP